MNNQQDEVEIKKPMEDLIENFINNLDKLNNNSDSVQIKKLLGISNINGSKNIEDYKQLLDENSIKYASVKSNSEVKKVIGVVKCIIPKSTFTIWIENILKLWISKLNGKNSNEIGILFSECEFNENNKLNEVISFNINERLWSAFMVSCKRENLNISQGFKYAMADYIINVNNEVIIKLE